MALRLFFLSLLVCFALAAVDPRVGFTAEDLADESSLRALFTRWSAKHGMTFSAEEGEKRFQIFVQNARRIHKRNSEGNTFVLGLNKFSHLTFDEFKAKYLGAVPPPPNARRANATRAAPKSRFGQPPDSIDWRDQGVVTDVKNQGQCGSCWSFATTGAIEGWNALNGGDLVPLSEQELVSCDTSDGGCNGGLPGNAMQWVIDNGGITSEDNYPYTAQDDACDDSQESLVTIDAYSDEQPNDEGVLQGYVAQQPVAVCVQATDDWMSYAGGVFNGQCGTDINHAVLAIGYGSGDSGDFWTIKNSWGPDWGDAGYISLARNVGTPEGTCGVSQFATFPTSGNGLKRKGAALRNALGRKAGGAAAVAATAAA